MTIALAPLVNGVELAAVICVVPGWAGSLVRVSAVVSSRMNSSCSNNRSGVLRVAGIVTGMTSLANLPESRAALACCCERNANASIS